MVVLNLYPKGRLEYNNKEIYSTGLNNKATIAIKDIRNIEFCEPTMFKNGTIKIKASSLNREIECIFKKKQLDNAKIAYSEILTFMDEYKNNNSQTDIQFGENIEETNVPDIFECEISEGTVSYTQDRTIEKYKAKVILHENFLEIIKSSYWRGKDRGSKEVLYNNITSVDLDIGGFLKWHAIELTASGSEIICLIHMNQDEITVFYNHLKEIIREYNLNQEKQNIPQQVTTINNTTDADELIKWHQMMEQGIITQEEFEQKKKQLLGL